MFCLTGVCSIEAGDVDMSVLPQVTLPKDVSSTILLLIAADEEFKHTGNGKDVNSVGVTLVLVTDFLKA